MCKNADKGLGVVRPTSPAHAPRPIYRCTALNTCAPLLPTHPPRLGPRRAISGDLALSRAISGPRRAISGDLGASLAPVHAALVLARKAFPGTTMVTAVKFCSHI